MSKILQLQQLAVPFPKTLYVDGYEVNIGRVEDNALVLPQPYISSRHANITFQDGEYWLKDLESTNGTAVIALGKFNELSGKTSKQIIESGNELLFGSAKEPIRFRATIYDSETTERSAAVIATESLGASERYKTALSQSEHATALRALAKRLSAADQIEDAAAILVEELVEIFPELTDAVFALKSVDNTLKPVAVSCSRGTPRSLSPLAKPAATMDRALVIGRRLVESGSEGLGDWKRELIALPLRHENRSLGMLQLGSNPGFAAPETTILIVAGLLQSVQSLHAASNRGLAAEIDAESVDASVLIELDGSEIPLIAAAPTTKAAFQKAEAAAPSDVWVTLIGPVGSGKTRLAQFIQQKSQRRKLPLITIDCAAIGSPAIESRLWGSGETDGLLAKGNGGTLFLDNVEYLDSGLQQRILSALENGVLESAHSTHRILDLRLITASSLSAEDLISGDTFDRSFAHRLQAYIVELPPLHQRYEDIPLLIQLYAEEHCAALGKALPIFDSSFVTALAGYDFPGNVRELIGEVQAALVHAEEGMPVTAGDLSAHVAQSSTAVASGTTKRPTLKQQLDKKEREIIAESLHRHGGRIASAAAEMGITRQGLAKKIDRLGIRTV